MKCKHCGHELVPVTIYVDASSLIAVGHAPAGYVPQQPPVWLSGWQPVEQGVTISLPNAAAAAPCVPSMLSVACQHEPESTPHPSYDPNLIITVTKP